MAICGMCDKDSAIIAGSGKCPACEFDANGYIEPNGMRLPVTLFIEDWDIIVDVMSKASNAQANAIAATIDRQVEETLDRF